jgi:hypothetical protein
MWLLAVTAGPVAWSMVPCSWSSPALASTLRPGNPNFDLVGPGSASVLAFTGLVVAIVGAVVAFRGFASAVVDILGRP